MKSPEHWASLFFSNKIKFLPDLVKQVQEEAKAEFIAAINETIEEIKKPKL